MGAGSAAGTSGAAGMVMAFSSVGGVVITIAGIVIVWILMNNLSKDHPVAQRLRGTVT